MVDTRACVRRGPRRNAAVWAMDAWEAMANAMLLVRRVVVRIGVWRRLVQKAKNRGSCVCHPKAVAAFRARVAASVWERLGRQFLRRSMDT